MKRPDTIMIEGHAYSWRVILYQPTELLTLKSIPTTEPM